MTLPDGYWNPEIKIGNPFNFTDCEKSIGDVCNANYMQVVPMAHEERVKQYLKCKKKDLAEWLATNNEMYNPGMYPIKTKESASYTLTVAP